MEQELVWSAVVAWMTSKGIEIAKRVEWLPIDATTEKLNWFVARLAAVITAVGVHASFDPQAGVLMVTGLTPFGIFQALLEYAKQLMFQEVAYKKFIKADTAEE